MDILRNAGVAALPYLDRAVTELNGYVYRTRSQRAADAAAARRDRENAKTLGIHPIKQYGPQKLKDHRQNGILEPTKDANNPQDTTAVEVDGSQDIPVSNQLIPLAIDFKWVFNCKYNSRFYRNADAKDTLLNLYKEISRTVTDGPDTLK